MKNSRIFVLALCGICLLGGCGSRNGEEREKEEAVMAAAENAQEDLHETDAVAGEDILSSSDTMAGDNTAGSTTDSTDNSANNTDNNADGTEAGSENELVIEMGPDREVWEEGNVICTLHSFRLYDSPGDVSVNEDDMYTIDARSYMDRSKFLLMQVDIHNIDYKGDPDDGSINVSRFMIVPEEYGGLGDWDNSYPVYLSEAGTGETDYYHVMVDEGETKSFTIGYYVPVKDAGELRSKCRIVVSERYFEIPETE